MKNKENESMVKFRNLFSSNKDIIVENWLSVSSLRDMKTLAPNLYSEYLKKPDDLKELVGQFFIATNAHRIQEIGLILEACDYPLWKHYMEIGVGWGVTCSSMAGLIFSREDKRECSLTTVDFKGSRIAGKKISNARQININSIISENQYSQWSHSDVGSDIFFKTLEQTSPKKKSAGIDVVFIDGDHSFKQTKRDWENVSKHLSESGIVFMHDLKWRTQKLNYPNVALRAFELIPGDKWDRYILDTPYRLGVVHRKSAGSTKEWLEEKIKHLNIKIRPWDRRKDK